MLDSPIRVIRSTFRWIQLFGSFGQLVFVFVDRGDGVFDSDSPIRVIRSTFRWI